MANILLTMGNGLKGTGKKDMHELREHGVNSGMPSQRKRTLPLQAHVVSQGVLH